MRKIAILTTFLLLLGSCRKMTTDYQERKDGVLKVCPKCNFVLSQQNYYAVDTSINPNIIYIVYFKQGGIFFKASDVDHLVRVN